MSIDEYKNGAAFIAAAHNHFTELLDSAERLAALEERVKRFIAAAEKQKEWREPGQMLQHSPFCNSPDDSLAQCNCGISDLQEALRFAAQLTEKEKSDAA